MSNAEYNQQSEDISKSWSLHRELESDRRSILRDISALENSVDLVRKQQFKFENTSKKTNKDLEELTGNCDECWYYTFDHGADLIEEYMAQLCKKVNDVTESIAYNKERRNKLTDAHNEFGNKLRKEFHSKEAVAA
tara:strand:+ start:125 stop:532 length:408 start_codon:yes stop_codon:yes gene_type:complete